jgi:hypothetical protein
VAEEAAPIARVGHLRTVFELETVSSWQRQSVAAFQFDWQPSKKTREKRAYL